MGEGNERRRGGEGGGGVAGVTVITNITHTHTHTHTLLLLDFRSSSPIFHPSPSSPLHRLLSFLSCHQPPLPSPPSPSSVTSLHHPSHPLTLSSPPFILSYSLSPSSSLPPPPLLFHPLHTCRPDYADECLLRGPKKQIRAEEPLDCDMAIPPRPAGGRH